MAIKYGGELPKLLNAVNAKLCRLRPASDYRGGRLRQVRRARVQQQATIKRNPFNRRLDYPKLRIV
jgi:hypothetical protein